MDGLDSYPGPGNPRSGALTRRMSSLNKTSLATRASNGSERAREVGINWRGGGEPSPAGTASPSSLCTVSASQGRCCDGFTGRVNKNLPPNTLLPLTRTSMELKS